MKVGVVKEIKSDEYRVALTPAGARELVQGGHDVVVETGAGEGSSFPDDVYRAVGATLASVDEVWRDSELLLKVKEPIPAEYPRLREGLVLFTYLHLAASEPLTRALVESGAACVAYETVETDERRAAAARADERGRRPARGAGRCVLPREAARRPRPAARRRARSIARPRTRDRRRDRRLQRRRDRAGLRRERDHPRALGRSDAPPRRDPVGPGEPRDVVDAPDRGVGRGGRRRDRRRADPRRAWRRSSSRARWSRR